MPAQTGKGWLFFCFAFQIWVCFSFVPVLRKFAEAEEDCSQALELDDKNVKALYRRVLARKVELVLCASSCTFGVG